MKGATTPQAKLVRRAKKARLYLVDTVAAKDQVHGCLKIETPGPGYQHFPQDLEADYFEQLLAERPVHKAGRRGWEKITADARNEALDLEVYILAALAIVAPRDLEALVAKAAGAAQAAETPAVESEPDPALPQEPRSIAARPAPRTILPRRPGFPRGFGGGGGSGAW